MSVWSSASGSITIRKDKHISIGKVIKNTLTDEFSFVIHKREEINECYQYEVDFSVCMDGEDFCRRREEFFKALGAERVDLTFELRFFQ